MKDASWYDVLLTPWRVAPHPNKPSRTVNGKQAIALLIEGRFLDYNRYAEADESLPELGRVAESDEASSSSTILALRSLIRLVTGEGDPGPDFFGLVRGRAPTPLKVVAIIFGSISSADQNQQTLALTELDAFLMRTDFKSDEIGRVLLLLQKALRQAETGAWEAAASTLDTAIDQMRTQESEVFTALHQVADLNRWIYMSRVTVDPGEFPGIQRRPINDLLARPSVRESSALHSYIKKRFGSVIDDPYGNTVTWSAGDPVEIGLWVSLMLSEIRGDFTDAKAARLSLARYRLLEATEGSDVDIGEALRMLLRSGDDKSIRAASRTFLRQGPLIPLAQLTSGTVTAEWTAANTRAFIAFLRQTADLVDVSERQPLINRLLELSSDAGTASVESRLMNQLGHEPLEVVAELVQLANVETHEWVAQRLSSIAVESDALIDQTLGNLLYKLDWANISADVRGRWREFAVTQIEEKTERRTALVVLERLARLGDGSAAAALLAAFNRAPTLHSAAALIDAGIHLPPSSIKAIRDLALERMGKVADKARRGSFGWGGVSAPALLAVVLFRTKNVDAWRRLTSFLLDAHVAQGDKEPALEILALHHDQLPEDVRHRLTKGARELLESDTRSFFGRPRPNAAAFRLLLSIRAITRAESIAALSDLLGSGDPVRRIEGSKSLPYALGMLDPDLIDTMALNLSRDPDVLVRAQAGNFLAGRVGQQETVALRSLIEERVANLIQEPGAMIAVGVLQGLESAKGQVGQKLEEVIDEARATHPSYRVRRAAEAVTDAMGRVS